MGAEKHPDDKVQAGQDAAVQHVNPAPDNAGAERYPAVKKDDAIDPGAARGPERKTFEGVENPAPQGTGDGEPRRSSDPTLDQSAAKR